jgi:hypothetical protein
MDLLALFVAAIDNPLSLGCFAWHLRCCRGNIALLITLEAGAGHLFGDKFEHVPKDARVQSDIDVAAAYISTESFNGGTELRHGQCSGVNENQESDHHELHW